MVVAAISNTGRMRLTTAPRIAVSYSLPSSICRSISPISTMVFLISRPIKVSVPSIDMK